MALSPRAEARTIGAPDLDAKVTVDADVVAEPEVPAAQDEDEAEAPEVLATQDVDEADEEAAATEDGDEDPGDAIGLDLILARPPVVLGRLMTIVSNGRTPPKGKSRTGAAIARDCTRPPPRRD